MSDANISDDGFWVLHEGQWIPTEKQINALSLGAMPHLDAGGLEKVSSVFTEHGGEVVDDSLLNQKQSSSLFRKPVLFSAAFCAIVVALIIVISSQSPGTISLLDEVRDSDGDGITDYDEIESGTDPMLADSDNDELDDNEDDCPIGEVD